MTNFKYTDPEKRLYHAYGIVLPGRVVAVEPNADGESIPPDFRWEETSDEVTDAPLAPGVLTGGDPYEVVDPDNIPPDVEPPPVPAAGADAIAKVAKPAPLPPAAPDAPVTPDPNAPATPTA